MTMNRIKMAVAGGLIGLTALGATAVVPTIAEAQTQDGTEFSQEERETLRAERQEARAERKAAMAELLGTDVEGLQAAREDGQSIAAIAAANGVDLQDVIDTMIANKEARIQEKVDAGDITAEEAADKLAGLEERVTEKVNAEPGERGDGEGRRGNGSRGNGGAGGDAAEPAAA